jgi:nitrogen regulation protein NR(I)
MSKILVVDDESSVLRAFQELLRTGGNDVHTAMNAEVAIRLVEETRYDLVIMDVCLSGMDGLDALRRIKEKQATLPVIVMTAHGTMQTAIEATKLGAFDYHLKPFDPGEMIDTIEKALASTRLSRNEVRLDSESGEEWTGDVIVGRCPAMQHVYKAIGRVAATDATVLIRGESGTGKELVARAIHQHSHRSNKPLYVVNCVAIPDTLLESELFGYERGAFTGASARKIGKFERASGATLLLDEIGDIPLGIQAKILRVLQERCFERLGGNETIQVDVRVLAATHQNLEAAIAQGEFREDLYHRLNVVTISVPPLRDRREDIPRLVDFFLERVAQQLGFTKPPLAEDALALLVRSDWPGNVRQLAHCLHRALIFTKGYPIQAEDLPTETTSSVRTSDGYDSWLERLRELICDYLGEHLGSRALLDFAEAAERMMIAEALRQTNWNQTHASRLLGLARPTLHARMRKYDLLGDGD